MRNGRSACRSPSRMDGSSRRMQFCKTLHTVQGNWITTSLGMYLRIASMTARRCSRTRESWPKMMSYGCMALKPQWLARIEMMEQPLKISRTSTVFCRRGNHARPRWAL